MTRGTTLIVQKRTCFGVDNGVLPGRPTDYWFRLAPQKCGSSYSIRQAFTVPDSLFSACRITLFLIENVLFFSDYKEEGERKQPDFSKLRLS